MSIWDTTRDVASRVLHYPLNDDDETEIEGANTVSLELGCGGEMVITQYFGEPVIWRGPEDGYTDIQEAIANSPYTPHANCRCMYSSGKVKVDGDTFDVDGGHIDGQDGSESAHSG